MTKLHQLVAVMPARKSRAQSVIDSAYHNAQKGPLFEGLAKSYLPRDDDDVRYPDEGNNVQLKAWELLGVAGSAFADLLDIVATADTTNAVASAPVEIDGVALTEPIPVTTLIAMERHLGNLATLIGKMPVQDAGKNWTFDDGGGIYVSEPVDSFKTKKVPRNHVKAEATDKHPAQVEVYTEDQVVGTWTTVKFTGALPATRRTELLARTAKLQDAVKAARSKANDAEVRDNKIGKVLVDYVLAR